MIRNDIFKFSHPEKESSGSAPRPEGNRLVHDDIERRHAVSGEQSAKVTVVNLVNIPNLRLAGLSGGIPLSMSVLVTAFIFCPMIFRNKAFDLPALQQTRAWASSPFHTRKRGLTAAFCRQEPSEGSNYAAFLAKISPRKRGREARRAEGWHA